MENNVYIFLNEWKIIKNFFKIVFMQDLSNC